MGDYLFQNFLALWNGDGDVKYGKHGRFYHVHVDWFANLVCLLVVDGRVERRRFHARGQFASVER